jgi:thiaminase
MAFVNKMWDAAAMCITATEKHSFFDQMLDGSLPMEKFQFYTIQVKQFCFFNIDLVDAFYFHKSGS